MTPLRLLLCATVISVATAGPTFAATVMGGGQMTLTFPTRTVSASYDPAAMRHVSVVFKDEAKDLSWPDVQAVEAGLKPLEGTIDSGKALLIAVEYPRADEAARPLAYARAQTLRARLIADMPALPQDRMVVAALPTDADDPLGHTNVVFLAIEPELKTASARTGSDPIRAVALDSAFIGPVYAELGVAGAAAQPAPEPKPAAQTAESGNGDEASTPALPPTPAPAPTLAPAPTPAPHANAFAEAVPGPMPAPQAAPKAAPKVAPKAARARPTYHVGWCTPPKIILDDFYPGGPIVPCK